MDSFVQYANAKSDNYQMFKSHHLYYLNFYNYYFAMSQTTAQAAFQSKTKSIVKKRSQSGEGFG